MSELETPTPVEELLPWYLNGSLGEEELTRVQAALEESGDLRTRLVELASFAAEVTARPDAETLVAFAAGRLDAESTLKVETYLAEPDSGLAADDAALVELARLGLASAEEEPEDSQPAPAKHPQTVTMRGSGNQPVALWRTLAAAAGVLAVAGWGTWWVDGRRGSIDGNALIPVDFVELAPTATLRSTSAAPPVALRGRQAVLLLVEAEVRELGTWFVEARDGSGQVVDRWAVSPPADGMVTLLLDADRLADKTVELALTTGDGGATTIHRYAVR